MQISCKEGFTFCFFQNRAVSPLESHCSKTFIRACWEFGISLLIHLSMLLQIILNSTNNKMSGLISFSLLLCKVYKRYSKYMFIESTHELLYCELFCTFSYFFSEILDEYDAGNDVHFLSSLISDTFVVLIIDFWTNCLFRGPFDKVFQSRHHDYWYVAGKIIGVYLSFEISLRKFT